jgi:hypothetical protein
VINEWETMWDEEVVAELEARLGICLGGIDKKHQELKNIRPPGQLFVPLTF